MSFHGFPPANAVKQKPHPENPDAGKAAAHRDTVQRIYSTTLIVEGKANAVQGLCKYHASFYGASNTGAEARSDRHSAGGAASSAVSSMAALAIGGFQPQPVTVRNRLIALVLQPLFGDLPVVARGLIILSLRQNAHHVHNGKVPFFFFLIPRRADGLVLKKLKLFIVRHTVTAFAGHYATPPHRTQTNQNTIF